MMAKDSLPTVNPFFSLCFKLFWWEKKTWWDSVFWPNLWKKVASCSTFLPHLSQLSRLVSRLLHRFGDELRDLEAHLWGKSNTEPVEQMTQASRPRLWCRFGVSGSKIWVRSSCDENEHFDSPNHEVHSFQPHTYHHIAANARWPFRCSECVLIVCLCACTNVYACLRTCNICICNLFLKICFRLSYMLFEYMHTFK